jgi:anti-anti-sigma factor
MPEPARPAISISRVRNRVVVTLRGALDDYAAPLLHPLLRDLIDGQGNLHVVIDLRDVLTIDQAGMGMLAGISERMRHHGGRIEFTGADLP